MRNGGMYNYAAQPNELIRRIKNVNPTLANELSGLKLPWYTIKDQSTTDDEADVFVYDVIGGWFGVDATEFVQELSNITASKVNVRINSPGGSVYDGIAIYNALMMHPADITVYVDSLCASIASVIAMAGDEIVMMPGSQMMIHDALGIEMGNAAEMRKFADQLDRQSQNIAGFYARKAGGEVDEWRDRMIAETWMFAQEAVDIGLADKVYAKSTEDDEEEETEETVETPDDTTDELDIDALMNVKHSVANRGFKYAGRKRAPDPTDHASFVGSLIDQMFDSGRK